MRRAVPALLLIAGCNALFGIEAGSHEPGTSPDGGESTADASATREDGSAAGDDDDAAGDASPAGASEPDRDAGPCVHTQTNPRHCGTCGHDCFEGECKQGICFDAVVTRSVGAEHIEVGETHIFWTTKAGLLWRAPLERGPAERVYDAGGEQAFGRNLLVSGGYVYFADRAVSRIARCPVSGPCNAETVMLGVGDPYSIATSRTHVYATNAPRGTTIFRCKKSSEPTGPCGPTEVFASSEVGIMSVVAESSDVVWNTVTSNGVAELRARSSLGSGAPTTVVSDPQAGVTGFPAVVLRSGLAYYVVKDELRRVGVLLEPPGASTKMFAINPTTTLRFVEESLYWTVESLGVYGRPIGPFVSVGSPGLLVVSAPAPVKDAAIHPKAFVWISGDNVMRRAR